MIPAKQRRISELTDDDVYTFVSLENTEFLFKEGSYANVYENYSLSSEVNASQTGNNNRMDGWASLLMDDAGNSIYAPVNMLSLWRRSGQGVPQGTGMTHGIVVHNELPRYGNVGRYQIRVLDESGFGMEWAGESAYTEFAEWDGNPHKYSFGTYAKLNSRYAYNRLESITPSDDISSDKTVPNAELFCENHVETTTTEAWPIAGTGNYNNPEVGSLGTSLTCKAYFVKAGVKGWYRWEGNATTACVWSSRPPRSAARTCFSASRSPRGPFRPTPRRPIRRTGAWSIPSTGDKAIRSARAPPRAPTTCTCVRCRGGTLRWPETATTPALRRVSGCPTTSSASLRRFSAGSGWRSASAPTTR